MKNIKEDNAAGNEMRETWVRSLGWEDPLEEGKTILQYSGLENSMDYIVQVS